MYRSLIDRLEQRSFGGAVSMPGMPLLELPAPEIPSIPIQTVPTQPAKQPERSVTCSGFVFARLSALRPDSSELKARLSEMLGEAATFLDACDTLVLDCENERLSVLERRHDEIRRQGRQQVALIKKCEKEFAEAMQWWNAAKETRQHRQFDLEQLLKHQQGMSRWASDREILDAKSAVAEAKEALRAAIEQDAQRLQAYNAADSALASAQATLTEWGKIEERVRAEISGLPYLDPELGLSNVDVSRQV